MSGRADGKTPSQVRRMRVNDRYPPPAAGHQRVPCFASDFAPCHCETHELFGVPATSVDWTARDRRYHMRCLNCGTEWSRAMGDRASGDSDRLCLDATHPEERALRAL